MYLEQILLHIDGKVGNVRVSHQREKVQDEASVLPQDVEGQTTVLAEIPNTHTYKTADENVSVQSLHENEKRMLWIDRCTYMRWRSFTHAREYGRKDATDIYVDT